ncbi:hypothetical protein ES319_A02G048600v1 [Gossypium barbadense]|uniref:Uncharacterized protein n=1 Tax=Gossypium barbadense TaxID=3634 RepID=A0A5J5WLK2_GOSBA|nr:hypothetical protein ES319_A02G048600v1 [Gossypium barbadense]
MLTHRRSLAKASSLPTTSSPMPISSTTSKTILMTPISTKKTKKNRFKYSSIFFFPFYFRFLGSEIS